MGEPALIATAADINGLGGSPVGDGGPASTTELVVYGCIADLMMILPLTLYIALNGTMNYSRYHQTMINMLMTAWAPLGIVWIVVMVDDSKMAREALTGALEMAALGPFALQWVGLVSFMMASNAGTDFWTVWQNIFFMAMYAITNGLMVWLHWTLTPAIYNWIDVSPYPAAEIARQAVAAETHKKAKGLKDSAEAAILSGLAPKVTVEEKGMNDEEDEEEDDGLLML